MPDRLSILGVGLRVDGHIVGDGSLEVRGHFEGTLHIGGELRVDVGAVVHADVLASRVLIQGRLSGRVRATKEVRVAASGLLEGDVDGPLVLDPGGTWRGERLGSAMRPQKTSGSGERAPAVSGATDEDERRTEGGMPAVGASSLRGKGLHERAQESRWYGPPSGEREASSDPIDLDAIEDEPPPTFSLSVIHAVSDQAIARRLAGVGESLPELPELPQLPERNDGAANATGRSGGAGADDPTDLPKGPSQLVIPDPPRARTTAPGVAPFRQSFGDALPAPAPNRPQTAPRVAAVSSTSHPEVPAPARPSAPAAPAPRRPSPPVAPAAPASTPAPVQDPDLSDSWFLPDDDL